MTEGALLGWRVLELADGVAATFCGKVLSDLGAEVVKVEPPGGHGLRRLGPAEPDADSARFTYLHTGKSSVVVSEDDAGAALVRNLVADAHVLVTDRDEAGLGRLGALPEGVIRASIRPFGLTGPAAARPAHHLTVFHSAGEGSILPSGPCYSMFPDRPPLQIGGGVAEYDAGWNAAVAVLAAMRGLARTGHARNIDVSMQESQLTLNRTRLSRFNNDGVVMGREGNRYGIYGMLRCADGWIQLVGMRPEHWDALLAHDAETSELEDAPLATAAARTEHEQLAGEALAAWCEARPKALVVDVLASIGCPVGAYATAADLLESPQLAHRGFFQQVLDTSGRMVTLPGVPYRLSRTPVRLSPSPELGAASGPTRAALDVPRAEGAAPAPLAGVHVLDFTWAAAGPYATLLLALLGADVLKIESGGRPDPARRGFLTDYGGIDKSPNFSELNLNKRAIQVDLRTDEGKALVWRLVDRVDVVVDNFRPGVMDRLGFGAEALLERRPDLVVACSSANGSTGPEAMAAGLASIFGATGGLSEQTGYEDGPPTEIGESTDYRSANALAVGILAALLHRDRTGEGQQVDLASREVVVASAPDPVLARSIGVEWTARLGNGHAEMAPHGVYRCAGDDSWLAVAVGNDREWQGLCEVLGRPEWVSAYATAAERRNVADIDEAIAAWAAGRPADDAATRLLGAGVAATPVLTNADLAADPHLAARGVFVDVEHPVIGRQRVMRAPWIFSDDPCEIRRAGPLLGQDNAEVLAELGITGEEAERLTEVMR